MPADNEIAAPDDAHKNDSARQAGLDASQGMSDSTKSLADIAKNSANINNRADEARQLFRYLGGGENGRSTETVNHSV